MKKKIPVYGLLCSMLVCALVCTLLCVCIPKETIVAAKPYYLLVKECNEQTVSASVGEVYSGGGAGIETSFDGKNFVVLAAYPHEDTAQKVQNQLLQKGETIGILALQGKEISLVGSEARLAQEICDNRNTVEGCIVLLYSLANELEKGTLSQERAKGILNGVVKTLEKQRVENGNNFPVWNQAVQEVEQQGKEMAEGIVFAKDVRRLQIRLCMAMAKGEEMFVN